MDSGKKKALTKVNWRPTKSCGTCAFGSFERGQYWGICLLMRNTYTHEKHKREHPLPASKLAVCDKWEKGKDFEYVENYLNGPITS